MKIYFYLFFSLIAFIMSPSLLAQVSEEEKLATLDNESNKRHIIKTNLLSALTKSASLSYEHALTSKLSVQPGLYYGKSNMLGGIKRLSATLDIRKYLSKQETVLVGIYVAPYLKYQQLTDFEEDYDGNTVAEASIYTAGGGLLLGRQWIAKKGFTVDMYIGGGYNPAVNMTNLQMTGNSEVYTFSKSKWQRDIRIGVSAGFAF